MGPDMFQLLSQKKENGKMKHEQLFVEVFFKFDHLYSPKWI